MFSSKLYRKYLGIAVIAAVLFCSTTLRADVSFIGGGGGGGGTITSGTWTPGVAGSTTAGAATYTVQVGNFIEFAVPGGQTWVYATFNVAVSAFSGGAGNLIVTGLPFTSVNSANQSFSGALTNTVGLTYTSASYTNAGTQLTPNTSNIQIIDSGSAQSAAAIAVGNLSTTGQMVGSIFFRVL